MTQTAHIGTPPIPLKIRHQPRARRYTLRISARDGSVSLTIPRAGNLKDGLDFARARENWLRGHLAKQRDGVRVEFGTILPLDGRDRLVKPRPGRGVEETDAALLVGGPADAVGVRLAAHLKLRARDRLAAMAQAHADRLGRQIGGIRITDARTRWGSCAHHGGLMFSWRLMLAPVPVQDYVAAHEVAHLAEMNHGSRFWGHVGDLCPDFEVQRGWLRQNGTSLHRFEFSGQ